MCICKPQKSVNSRTEIVIVIRGYQAGSLSYAHIPI